MHHSECPPLSETRIQNESKLDGTPPDSDGRDLSGCPVASCERFLAAGDLVAAREKLSAIETIAPSTEAEWKRLYSLALNLNDQSRAQVYTEKFLQVCENNTSAHLASARHFMPVYADRIKVKASLTAALENPRQDACFWREVTKIQSAIEDHEGVLRSAKQALALDPADLELREILISSLGVLRRTSEIRGESKRLAYFLTQSRVAEPLRWARLARIAAEAGALRQAKNYIDISIGCLDGINYGADFELARALLLTNQAPRAMTHIECLVRENSQNSWLWQTLVNTAMQTRSYEIALIAIARLKAIPYQDPEFLYRLSLTEKTASQKKSGNWVTFFPMVLNLLRRAYR